MTEYAILLPGDEDSWAAASPEHREATYAKHREFMRLVTERGHRITGGAELTHSHHGRLVTLGEAGRIVVTDGPYAESTEQLTGFYLIESDDLDDLMQLCGLLVEAEGAPVIVRATVSDEDAGGA
ncbi:MAG: YciI family protein [Nocardioides sp.]|uniref:YciI family protein n=1 Tax=Nocardioides sp. TaxID=35761 RepID=UPI0039E47DAE